MFGFFIFNILFVTLASADSTKHQHQYLKTVVPEQHVQSSHTLEIAEGFEPTHYGGEEIEAHVSADVGNGKGSSGAELTSLAHSSAVQAKNAVRSQHTAGSQAAFGIKSTLASAAIGAAQTAQAALVGKQAIVHNLKKQAVEAQHQLQAEISQYHQLESVSQAAAQASQDAHTLYNTLTAAVTSAQAGATHSQQAATEAANAAASQHAMVDEAKQRIAHILSQLQNTVSDLQETEASAIKAAESAHIAQSNAAAAGLAIAAASAKSGYHTEGGSEGYHHHY